MTLYSLQLVPIGSLANKVVVGQTVKDGRSVLRMALDQASRAGMPGVDFVDQPTFLLLPDRFTDGVIEVDVSARLLPDAPDYARGFIGLAYRVQPDFASYESVYIRPTNGRGHAPGPPRDQRAVQYYAYPDWPFDVLRTRDPGIYEAGADIQLDSWHGLRIEINSTNFNVFIDGSPVLTGTGKLDPRPGQVGLWVDIGTDGYFSNFAVYPA